MKPDPLERLLSLADTTAPPPAAIDGVVNRVRRRAARRATLRRAGAVLVIACVVGVALMWHGSKPKTPFVRTSPTNTGVELAQLRADAELHQRIADQLIEMRKQFRREAGARAALREPDALAQLDAAREQAAMVLVRDAARMARAADKRSAAETFRQAAESFPSTPAARIALERLRDLDSGSIIEPQSRS